MHDWCAFLLGGEGGVITTHSFSVALFNHTMPLLRQTEAEACEAGACVILYV